MTWWSGGIKPANQSSSLASYHLTTGPLSIKYRQLVLVQWFWIKYKYYFECLYAALTTGLMCLGSCRKAYLLLLFPLCVNRLVFPSLSSLWFIKQNWQHLDLGRPLLINSISPNLVNFLLKSFISSNIINQFLKTHYLTTTCLFLLYDYVTKKKI